MDVTDIIIIQNNGQLNQYLAIGALVTFLILLFAFIILSIILEHHWKLYGIMAENIKKVRLWYFGISSILLLTMLTVLLSF